MKIKLLFAAALVGLSSWAQETFPVNGMHPKPGVVHAFTNAHLVLNPKEEIKQGTLLIKDGKIISISSGNNVPEGAVVHDMEGKYIYPSFIDLYSDYGMPEVKRKPWSYEPQLESNTPGAFAWNEALKPEFDAASHFSHQKKQAENLRKNGFGVVLSHRMDGIARGTGALVSLADASENKTLLQSRVGAFYSFQKGSSRQNYPSSLMGAIALLRQTHYDAIWYKRQKQQVESNLSLEAWNANLEMPQFFYAGDYLSSLRADKICDEFAHQYIFIGSGDEYKRAKTIARTYGSFILPLNFPKPYDVEDPWDAELVSLEDMKHWEMAPKNAAILDHLSVEIAFTAHGSKNFLEEWRQTVEAGLPKEVALRALTITPAKLARVDQEIGSLKAGKWANFIVCSGDIFDEGSKIYANWIQGIPHQVEAEDNENHQGKYHLELDSLVTLKILGPGAKPKAKLIINDSTDLKVKMQFEGDLVSFHFYQDSVGTFSFTGYKNDEQWVGNFTRPDGSQSTWTLIGPHEEDAEEEKEEEKKDKEKPKRLRDKNGSKPQLSEFPEISFPNMAYGWKKAPEQAAVLFQNVTVWTNEEEGILENTDVAISNGEIIAIGKNLDPSNVFFKFKGKVEIVDGTGMHLTAGIIDEHSHIAISKGVNEGSQAVTAEVSIADVINSDDINIYRQLAGGVTSAQLLHGSANPIGGQSAIIKLRWGLSPEEMKFKEAPGFIKFALGENVKQSNWGDFNTVRYPQSRMGVEQIFYDNFIRAKEYEADWKAYGSLGLRKRNKINPPRRDLELQTLVEILNSERFVTCHSYIQSEINMLMHVADSMGFTMNTFTHILEGYKVADKMKAHGVGGSTFSDWWAYKYEVNDAIPYNGALLHGMGVITAFNSDDAEMARRLNQEAAKAVKYGGVSEEEAWKFVTLNPAKLLHVDKYVGSIKVGKQADIVLWSANPLSVEAKAMRTYVDGRCYFDRKTDEALREAIRAERARLIQAMLDAKAGGRETQKAKPKAHLLYHCDTMENYE